MSRPWMPLYIADYLADTAHLNAAESGAYLHLIMAYWQKGCLPTGDRQLATIAKMLPAEWAEAKPILAEFFGPDWTHARIDDELVKAQEKYEKRAAAGRKRHEHQPENDIDPALHEQCSSNADAGLNQPQPQPHSLSETSSEKRGKSNSQARDVRGELEAVLRAEIAQAVIDHRRAKKAALTPLAAQRLASQFASCPDPNEAAATMVERGWQGFKPEWLDQTQRQAPRGQANEPGSRFRQAFDQLNAGIAAARERDRGPTGGDGPGETVLSLVAGRGV